MAYTTGEIVEPFWAEYSSAASGRDPLAIQNSSVVIYTKMVIGITNVTNRIRYNGFFCWIFDTILKNIDKKNSLQEQIRYSRRAELLLAYIMVNNYKGVTGVSGSSYATNHMGDTIDIAKGADWEYKKQGDKVYWQNKQGVFGQYYSGVTRVLNLINPPNPQLKLNIYTLTEKGTELAMAFSENIDKEERELFWKSVFNGRVKEADLENLKSFALHQIPENSEELNFYQNTILAADDRKVIPTFHRRESIKLLLSYLRENDEGVENPVSTFLSANYNTHLNESTLNNDTGTAWYMFEINELLHVAFEHFHGCFLYYIETYPTLLEDNISDLIDETIVAFKQDEPFNKVNSVGQLVEYFEANENDIYRSYQEMGKAFHSGDFGICLMNAVKIIVQLYVNSSQHLDQLAEFAARPEFNFNRIGYAIDLFGELFATQQELTIEEYVKAILLKAINVHTFSSYSKTKIGQRLVHNYLIEDYSVWRLRETLPSRTNPRMQNALQYITDIGWTKREEKAYKITNDGINVIESL